METWLDTLTGLFTATRQAEGKKQEHRRRLQGETRGRVDSGSNEAGRYPEVYSPQLPRWCQRSQVNEILVISHQWHGGYDRSYFRVLASEATRGNQALNIAKRIGSRSGHVPTTSISCSC